MKFNLKRTLGLCAVLFSSLLFVNYSSSPAQSGLNRTGAPFDVGTCSGCHSGGSFSSTVTLQLLNSSNVPVTVYTPGALYTVKLTRSGSGIPANGGFGFQMTCATVVGNLNNNSWGTALPFGTAKHTLSQRRYIEHTSKLPSTTTSLSFPWTAPDTNVISVKFYVALNNVNGNGQFSGDQTVSTSLQIDPDPLPITWLYFKARNNQGNVSLEWASANEKNNLKYLVERSVDGRNFDRIGTVNSKSTNSDKEHAYSFTDLNPLPRAFYRIGQQDLDGTIAYYKTLEVVSNSEVSKSYHTVSANSVKLYVNQATPANATVKLYNLNGQAVQAAQSLLTPGVNVLELDRPALPGLYILDMEIDGKRSYQERVLIF
jgi:hypothetical protein